MKNFIKSMFTDENGQVSSKRVAGMLCVVALVITLVADVFTHGEFKPSDTLVNTIGLFAFGALGLTSIYKFIKNKNKV
jgi:hypothetical protein